jgi:hypothetical protein
MHDEALLGVSAFMFYQCEFLPFRQWDDLRRAQTGPALVLHTF